MPELLLELVNVLATFAAWVLVLFFASRRHPLPSMKFWSIMLAAAVQCVAFLVYSAYFGTEMNAFNRFVTVMLIFRSLLLFVVFRGQVYQNLFYLFVLLQIVTFSQSNANFVETQIMQVSLLSGRIIYHITVFASLVIVLPPMIYVLRRLQKHLRPENEVPMWRSLWLVPMCLLAITILTSPVVSISLPLAAQYVRAPVLLAGRIVVLLALWLVLYVVGDVMRLTHETEQARQNEQIIRLQAKNLKKDLQLHKQLIDCIPKEDLVTFGHFTLNTAANQAYLRSEDMLLAPKDFALLYCLIKNAGKTVPRETLSAEAWHQTLAPKDRALDSSVYRLRKKLTGSGYTITAVRGEGFLFEQE